SATAVRNVRARGTRLRCERLHLLSQPASARRLRGGRYRTKMGKSSQRAARLHFRADSVSWETADGPGHRKHRRASPCGTDEACSSCASCGGITGSRSDSKCESCCFTKPGSWCAMASSNRWRATDVLRGVASCASLFAAQHQHRFEHAVLSFPL